MKTLDFNQMENLEGGKFWGKDDFNCHHTSAYGLYCCWNYYAFGIVINHNCGFTHPVMYD